VRKRRRHHCQQLKKGPLTPYEIRDVSQQRHPEELELNRRFAAIRRIPLPRQPSVWCTAVQLQAEEVVQPDDEQVGMVRLNRIYAKLGADLQRLHPSYLSGFPKPGRCPGFSLFDRPPDTCIPTSGSYACPNTGSLFHCLMYATIFLVITAFLGRTIYPTGLTVCVAALSSSRICSSSWTLRLSPMIRDTSQPAAANSASVAAPTAS